MTQRSELPNFLDELEIYQYRTGLLYAFAQYKRDGYALQISKDAEGRVVCNTRHPTYSVSRQDWFTRIADVIPKNTAVLGELFVEGGESTDVRSVLCAEPSKVGSFEVFAVPFWEGQDLRRAAFEDVANFAVASRLPFIPYTKGMSGGVVLDSMKYEGWVLKTNHMPQFPRDWMKLKAEYPMDLRVTGFTEGKGQHVGKIGSVLCESDCGTIKTAVGGMSQGVRDHMTQHSQWWIGKIIEVKAQKILRTGGVRHPRYERLREDKNVTSIQ